MTENVTEFKTEYKYNKVPKLDLLVYLMRNYDIDIDPAMSKKELSKIANEQQINPLSIPIKEKELKRSAFQQKLFKAYPKKLDEAEEAEKIENLTITKQEFGNTGKKLLFYQKKFVKAFNYANIDGALMLYGVGTGKTLCGLATALRYLQLYPSNKVIICTPKALMNNWIVDLHAIGINPNYSKFKFVTYDSLNKVNIPKLIMKDALVIFDEAHIMRTIIKKSEEMYEGELIRTISKGVKVDKIMQLNQLAHKTILLTGTPFVNTIQDIYNLLMLSNQSVILTDDSIDLEKILYPAQKMNMDQMHNLFDYRVDIYYLQKYNEDGTLNLLYAQYPKVKMEYVPIVLNNEEEEKYHDFMEENQNTDSFYFDKRMGSNMMGYAKNKKLKYILDLINKPIISNGVSYKRRVVIYSTFVSTVIKLLKEILKKRGIGFSEVTGKTKDSTSDYVNGINNVFIISKAGTEGLNLLRTDDLVIYEPIFNEASIVQAMARGVRFKSHVGHHTNEITIHRLLTVFESDMPEFTKLKKTLEHIDEIFDEGLELEDDIVRTFFDTYKRKDSGSSGIVHFNSVDLQLLVMSKYKQTYLTTFFDKIKDDVIETKEYHNKLLTHIEDYVRSKNEDSTKILPTKEINKIINKFILEEVPTILNKRSKISRVKIVEEDLSKWEKHLHSKERKLQQYFTPDGFSDLFVSDIIDFKNKNIKILEPTAGQGALIKACMRLNETYTDTIINYTAVEFDKENIDVLRKDFTNFPLVDIKHGDFMEFVCAEQFDYIVMNPPFNLKVKNSQGKYLRDVDFVEKAFSYLKVGGKLKAIIYYGSDKRLNEQLKRFVINKLDIDFAKEKGKYGKWASNKELKGLKITIITMKKS